MKTSRPCARVFGGSFFLGLLFCSSGPTSNARAKDLKEVEIYMTAEEGSYRLANRGFRAFEPLDQPDESYPTIMIDLDKTFQTIEGFGGAFTDAAAITFGKLSPERQQEFLTACFDPQKGNAYTLCRTTLHSCDYSDEQYTYDDVPGARRIACTSNSDDFIATGFVNPDGEVAVVILNLKDNEQFLQLWVSGKAAKFTSPARALITMVL